MDRRVPDSHYTALGLPLWARRTSWAEAELEQEVPVRGLGLQEDEWTSAVATGRRGLQRRWRWSPQLVWRMQQPPPFAVRVE